MTGVLDRSIAGTGAVVGLAAPPGVGKSRLVAELAAVAASRGVPVYSTFCESHASEIPFHAVSRLLRGTFGVDELTDDAARPGVLVEALLLRGSAGDVEAAQEAIDRSEAVPMEDFQGMNVQHLRLRAMIAKARGDHNEYREIADRYRAFATSLGYSGHIAAAKAMT